MPLDVARVRGLIPALGDGWAHLDAQLGMQVPERVATAVATELRVPRAGPGCPHPAARRAAQVLEEARQAVADLVGGDPRGVVLGPGPTTLLSRLADALSENWVLGDQLVATRVDPPGSLAPWTRAAHRAGASVQFAEVDVETCELPVWQFDELVTGATKVVTLTAACAQVGTRTDVPRIAERVRPRGALVVVDAGAAVPHLPLDIEAMGADVLVLDAAAWGGPPLGALVFRRPVLLDRMPSRAADRDARGATRLEVDAHPVPLLAGLVASVNHLAGLDEAAGGSRRERLLASLGSAKDYETGLLARLLTELRTLPYVTVIGDAARRVPALAFTVAGVDAPQVVEHLARHRVCAFADPARWGTLAAVGGADVGGVVRVGLAPYTSPLEVGQLVDALADLR